MNNPILQEPKLQVELLRVPVRAEVSECSVTENTGRCLLSPFRLCVTVSVPPMLSGECPCRTALQGDLTCPPVTPRPEMPPLHQPPCMECLLCARLWDLVLFTLRLRFSLYTK